MGTPRYRELGILLAGDTVLFVAALWVTLALRYQELPDMATWEQHFVPFSMLFTVWIFIFFVAGLYDKQTILVKRELPLTIAAAQVVNVAAAALFFFLVPLFQITPKTNLAIYLVISIALISLWRLVLVQKFAPRKRHRALLIGDGPELSELAHEVNENERYSFRIVRVIDTNTFQATPNVEGRLLDVLEKQKISLIIGDPRSETLRPLMPLVYDLTFLGLRVNFMEFTRAYEDIFDRVPLSVLRYDWFLEYVYNSSLKLYELTKRLIDVVAALILGAIVIVLTPLIWAAMRLEDDGPLFITQSRVGRYNTPLVIRKFRTMTHSEDGVWLGETQNRVTRVGSILRKTSLDEFPQLLNVLKGEMSLIGPRNDVTGLAARLSEEIPYYHVRYIIKPGITGWAQTNQHYSPGQISPQSIEETKLRLAYDLYYIKHRSFSLDLVIALRTIKTLLARLGSLLFLRYHSSTNRVPSQ